ncbi:MAG: hypothetical protein Q7S31_01370 [bacterium]|nr:hypothetical protein [bacterium]
MKKEVILAITIGFALGLVITFGIWTANRSLKNLPVNPASTPLTVAATPTPSSDQAQKVSLALTTPADEALVTTNKITVSGKTVAAAAVIILSENGQQALAADDKGEFSLEVSLVGGYNTIRVIVFDKDGNTTEQSVVVTYTTAKI